MLPKYLPKLLCAVAAFVVLADGKRTSAAPGGVVKGATPPEAAEPTGPPSGPAGRRIGGRKKGLRTLALLLGAAGQHRGEAFVPGPPRAAGRAPPAPVETNTHDAFADDLPGAGVAAPGQKETALKYSRRYYANEWDDGYYYGDDRRYYGGDGYGRRWASNERTNWPSDQYIRGQEGPLSRPRWGGGFYDEYGQDYYGYGNDRYGRGLDAYDEYSGRVRYTPGTYGSLRPDQPDENWNRATRGRWSSWADRNGRGERYGRGGRGYYYG